MQRININIHPHKGYIFRERDGTSLVGSSWKATIARVRAYRQRAGLPPGDPDKEVIQQACEKNPGLCRDDDGSHEAAVKVANLKGRVLAWFSAIRKRMASQPLDFAPPEYVVNRVNVCLGCEHNKEMTDAGCGSCKNTVKELQNAVIGGRRADPRLAHRGCNVTGEHLATTAWLEQLTIANPELPGHCWRKRTL